MGDEKKSPIAAGPSSADLTYYIVEGVLAGSVGDQAIHICAWSGGGGGSTKNRASYTANNPYMEALKTVGDGKQHVHGGPLPPGKYIIGKPVHSSHLGLCASLTHTKLKTPMGRSGFYIHGRGPHGSDGCVVPTDKIEFKRLMDLLTKSGGGSMWVLETMSDVGYA